MTIVITVFLLLLGFVLSFRGHGYWAWVVPGAVGIGLWGAATPSSVTVGIVALLFGSLAFIFGVPVLRERIVSRVVMGRIGPLLPVLGETERIALEAGTVW